jgi:hypothetical protein
VNLYLQTLKGFCTWCVRNRRLTSNPLQNIDKADEKSDRRLVRRALTELELLRLLYVTRWRPLAELGRETIRKPASKVTGKRDTWNPAPLTFETIDAAVELARTRLAEKPKRIDVHALRHTFGTMLSQNGVAPRTAQSAMRHSKIDLTMNCYTDPRLLDVAGALDQLPAFSLNRPASQESDTALATGTDDQQHGFRKLTPMLDKNEVPGGISGAKPVTLGKMTEPLAGPMSPSKKGPKHNEKDPLSVADNGSLSRVSNRVRTGDLRNHNPAKTDLLSLPSDGTGT